MKKREGENESDLLLFYCLRSGVVLERKRESTFWKRGQKFGSGSALREESGIQDLVWELGSSGTRDRQKKDVWCGVVWAIYLICCFRRMV